MKSHARQGFAIWASRNCGPIDSLAPIAALQELEHLHMYDSTRITDGI